MCSQNMSSRFLIPSTNSMFHDHWFALLINRNNLKEKTETRILTNVRSCWTVFREFSNEKLLGHLMKWRWSFATVSTKPTVGLRNNVPLQKGSKEHFLPDFFFLNIHSILVLHKEGKKQKREERIAVYTACLILFIKRKKEKLEGKQRSQLDLE